MSTLQVSLLETNNITGVITLTSNSVVTNSVVSNLVYSNSLTVGVSSNVIVNTSGFYTSQNTTVQGFKKNSKIVDVDINVANGENATHIGPITIAAGVTVTVAANARYLVV